MTATVPLTLAPREEQVFPVLTPAQLARLETHGKRRAVQRGEILMEAGAQLYPAFVVLAGALEAVRNSCAGEEVATTHRPGQFSGELNLVTGRRGLATIRVTEAGEVIEVERDSLLAMLQTDAELSEIFMRAFILRRVIAHRSRLRRRRRAGLAVLAANAGGPGVSVAQRASLLPISTSIRDEVSQESSIAGRSPRTTSRS